MFIELHDLMSDRPILINTANIFEVHGIGDGFSIVNSVADRSSGINVSDSYSEIRTLLASADKIVCSGSNECMDELVVPSYDEWSDELKQAYKDLLSKLNLSET